MENPPRPRTKMRVPRRDRRAALLIGALVFVIAFTQWRAAIARNRSIPDEPFQIADNLYYVGHTGVTMFLLTGPEGHVLIDGGYPESAPLVIESIRELGFDIKDVKVLLNSHAHPDHAGGLAELQEASGAELWVSEADAPVIAAGGRGGHQYLPLRMLTYVGLGSYPAARVDHRFADGAEARVGPLTLTANITPGHTPGCTSWSFPVQAEDLELLAVNICSLKLFGFESFVEPETYPGLRADYEGSLRTLRDLPADIFLASHPTWFGMYRKHRDQEQAANPAEPFIDPLGYRDFIKRAEVRYRDVLAAQQQRQ
ncbi:MAG: subclass B3 metallo-beta-lactamase [Acidobacteria bacterium]|nr:subclass B3 metallo-beta-lactamase [Acidobacteriota bacterium]